MRPKKKIATAKATDLFQRRAHRLEKSPPIESRYAMRKDLYPKSYSEDGIGILNPILGRGVDSRDLNIYV